MGYVGRGLNQEGGQYRKLDDISSGFNSSETSFSLTVSNLAVTPTAQNLLISINGVIQEPGSAFSMNGSTITFTEAPAGAASFFGIVMGEASYIAYDTVGANELGVTAGTVKASRSVVVDSSKDISGFNQVTSTTFSGIFSGALSSSAQIASDISGSENQTSASFSTRVTVTEASSSNINQDVKTSASPTFTAGTYTSDLGVSGSMTVKGSLTAQEFKTEFVSASIIYDSGSSKFGDTADDIHQMTGSLRITGSGNHYIQTGNVGIGTTSPSALLHIDEADAQIGLLVQGGSGGTDIARFQRDVGSTGIINIKSDGGNPQIEFNDEGTGIWSLGTVATGDSFRIAQNDSIGTNDKLTILSSGKVGIGTNNPSHKLHISGSTAGMMRIQRGAQFYDIQMGTGGELTFQHDGAADDVTFDTDGKVGIGTTSPDELLHINTSATAGGTDNPALRLQNPNTVSDARVGIALAVNANTGLNWDGAMIQAANNGVDGKGHILFGEVSNDSFTENVRFETGGNVGIGATSPSSLLEVAGADGTDGGELALTVLNGNVGTNDIIGKLVWKAPLENSPDGRLPGAAIWAEAQAGYTDSVNKTSLFFGTGNSESALDNKRMTIDENGNVGIGTGSPGSKLAVHANSAGSISTLIVDGDDGSNDGGAEVRLRYNGSQKWRILQRNQTSIGSAFALQILDAGEDDGVYINQGGSGWTDASDERLKTSIAPIENAVDKLNTLQAVNFKWKYGSEERQAKNNIGLLAQEVYEVFPEAVDHHDLDDFELIDHPTIEGTKQSQGAWGIDKSKLIPVLVKAVQELSAKVEALENA